MTRRQMSMSRRSLMRNAGLLTALGPLFKMTEGSLSAQARSGPVNKASAPSDLKITDLRGVTIDPNWNMHDFPLIRIDTNQGVYGLGEVFCGNVWTQAAVLKPFVVGKNPLQIESVLSGIRRLCAGPYPMGGGYSAIDTAMHDIAGKVYGVPCWRLLGNKLRDRVILYCDTDTQGRPDPKAYGAHMLTRKKAGFRFFKTDLGVGLVSNRPGAVDSRGVATAKGLEYLCEYLAAVRDVIGWDVPLACDHFGRVDVDDAIRYAKAFEPYSLAWAEDFLDASDWRGYKRITDSTTTPILTGENAFGLKEGFKDLLENRALDVIHPDVTDSGGMLEVKKIADYAAVYGIDVAIHQAASPVAAFASAHVAATLPNFLAQEFHCAEVPFWDDLVTGVPKPMVNDGYHVVPDTPGLGIELNEPVVREHMRIKGKNGYAAVDGYFEPTTMFDIPFIGGARIPRTPRPPAPKPPAK